MEERTFNVWMVVRPAPDVPGQWLAHCLEFDVVSQGDSVEQALRMGLEASVMVALEDLNSGRNPLERRAPENFFGELYGLFERSEKRSIAEIRACAAEGRLVCFATQFELPFYREAINHDVIAHSMRPTSISFAQQATC